MKSSVVANLYEKGKLQIPKHVPGAIQYECYMGSVCYGVSNNTSDIDVYGISIPPKEYVFPHKFGYIQGFGEKPPTFNVWQQHHIKINENEYDLSVYNIVSFFQLALENNPNIIDSLFVPSNYVTKMSEIGSMIRSNRRLFLHKGSYHKLKGYSFAQLKDVRNPNRQGKRKEIIEKYGYDIKAAYHVVRLSEQALQILTEGDLDLQRSKEMLKSIRRGEWSIDDIENHFKRTEEQLTKLYHSDSSPLPYSKKDNEPKIKQILIDCLEQFYGSISEMEYSNEGNSDAERKLNEIRRILG